MRSFTSSFVNLVSIMNISIITIIDVALIVSFFHSMSFNKPKMIVLFSILLAFSPFLMIESILKNN